MARFRSWDSVASSTTLWLLTSPCTPFEGWVLGGDGGSGCHAGRGAQQLEDRSWVPSTTAVRPAEIGLGHPGRQSGSRLLPSLLRQTVQASSQCPSPGLSSSQSARQAPVAVQLGGQSREALFNALADPAPPPFSSAPLSWKPSH